MARVVVAYFLLLFLSNSYLESVDAQSTKGKTSWDIITEVGTLTTAVEGLQAKIDGQAALLRNLTSKEEMSRNALNNFEEKLSALENLLINIETKMDAQANSLSALEAESKTQNGLLNNLQTTTVAMQAKMLNIFEEKFSSLANLVNNVMAEDQKQVTSLNNLEIKTDTQAVLLNNLHNSSLNNLQVTTAAMQVNLLSLFEEKFSLLANLVNNGIAENQKQETSLNSLHLKVTTQTDFLTSLNSSVSLQVTSLSNLQAESNLQNDLLNKLVATLTTQANEFNNFKTKIDTQTSILTNVQARSNLQGAMLGKMNSNQELQATSLSDLEAASKIHKNLLHGLQNTTVRHSNLLNNLQTKADLQATSINNLVAEVEWHEPVAHFQTHRTIVASIGDDVEMWCVVRGTPLPEMKWTRENGTLSDRVVVENNGKVLRIKNLQLSDEGVYVCAAANGVGNPVSQAVRLQVYGKYRQCNRMIESDKGILEIEPSNSSCLCVIKLQKTTGFRLELDPLMTESNLVIPEQNSSNSNAQSIWINGSKNVSSFEFEGKKIAILMLPGHERMTLNWTGLTANVSEITSTTKFLNEFEGTLEWDPVRDGSGKIFWEFSHEIPVEINWTLNTSFTAQDQENPCENIFFSVLQIRRDGTISEIERSCDGSSEGSLKLESNSRVLVLLHIKSADAAKSKLQVTWKYYDEPLKKNTEGIIVGTDPGGAVVIPFNSTQTKTSSSKDADGLAFDWNSRRIYWLEYGVGILRASWDGSQTKVLLSDPSSKLGGLAIEPISGNIYYGNKSSKAIRVCDTNASKCSTIASNSDLSDIEDLAVHRSKGFLFWSIWKQKIVRANLDGSNAKVILQGNVTRIDVDEYEVRLYWGSLKGIGSCDLNGQDIRMVPNLSTDVTDVAIDGENVYFGDWYTKSIKVTSKLGTNSRQVANLTGSFYHQALFGTQDPKKRPNLCENSQCAHLCTLITPRSYRCLCPDNQEQNPNGKTCKL